MFKMFKMYSLRYRDLLQQNDPTGRQRIRSYLGPTAEFYLIQYVLKT